MEPDQPSLTVRARTDPRRGRFGRSKFGQAYRDRVPGIVAAVTSITGVLNLLVALMPRERHRLHQLHEVLPVALSAGAVAIVAVSGLLLWRLGTTSCRELSLPDCLIGDWNRRNPRQVIPGGGSEWSGVTSS